MNKPNIHMFSLYNEFYFYDVKYKCYCKNSTRNICLFTRDNGWKRKFN